MTDDDLIAFLHACLDEDEQTARAAIQGPWQTGRVAEHLHNDVIYGVSPHDGDRIVQVANLEAAWGKQYNANHIVHWDPTRVLRQVRAGRELVNQYEQALQQMRADEMLNVRGSGLSAVTGLGYAVRRLAEVYEDRLGYNREWGAM